MENSENSFSIGGVAYVAVAETGGCAGCVFKSDIPGCGDSPSCFGQCRADGRDVIFVRASEQPAVAIDAAARTLQSVRAVAEAIGVLADRMEALAKELK